MSTRFYKNSGYSLVELLVGIAISSLVVMLAYVMSQQSFSNYVSLKDKFEREEELMNIELTLKNFFSNAINIQYINAPINGQDFSSNVGLISEYNIDDWTASDSNKIDAVSFFLRDAMNSGLDQISTTTLNANLDRRYLSSAIFFQRPTPTTYGVLYLHSSSNSAEVLKPSLADVRIGNVVDFQILNIGKVQFFNKTNELIDNILDGKWMASAVTVKIVVRHYLPNLNNQAKKWCPPQFINDADCVSNVSFKDIEKVFFFNLRNNILERGYTIKQITATGATTTNLPVYRRGADSIYFLKTNFPIGQIQR